MGLPARLVVAGDGPLRAPLERPPPATGCPSPSPGSCAAATDLAALLASADVAIAPGPAETFGLAALEALACGTPVVVSAESALPEVVGDAGASVAGEDLAAGVRRAVPAGAGPPGPRPGPGPNGTGGRGRCGAFVAVHEALADPAAGRGQPATAAAARGTTAAWSRPSGGSA